MLGAFGAHKFYLGYTGHAVFMLCATLIGGIVTFGVAAGLLGIIGLVEGIVYLTKSDADFTATYLQGKKAWF